MGEHRISSDNLTSSARDASPLVHNALVRKARDAGREHERRAGRGAAPAIGLHLKRTAFAVRRDSNPHPRCGDDKPKPSARPAFGVRAFKLCGAGVG